MPWLSCRSHVNEVIQATQDPAAQDQPLNPFLETARLWGEMMPRYTQFMLDAVRESMETPFAPNAFNEQLERAMDAALAAWGMAGRQPPAPAQADAAALNEELADLRRRLAALEEELRRARGNRSEDDDAANA